MGLEKKHIPCITVALTDLGKAQGQNSKDPCEECAHVCDGLKAGLFTTWW